jgi:hypothetical protein
VKHKDHLIKAEGIKHALLEYLEFLTLFTTWTSKSRWTLTSKSSIITWYANTSIETWINTTWITYILMNLFSSLLLKRNNLRAEQSKPEKPGGQIH